MAVRLNTSDDGYSRTTNLPNPTSVTVLGWFRLVNDRNTFTTFIHRRGSNDQADIQIQTNSDGTTLTLWDGNNITTGTNLTVGQWYHIGFTYDGTTIRVYLNGVEDFNDTDGNPNTMSTMYIGTSSYGGEWLDGRVAAVKGWSAVLTPAEIQHEMVQYQPVRTDNINFWLPMWSTNGDEIDHSGNGTFTVLGAHATEDGPPIPYGPVRSTMFLPAAAAPPAGGRTGQLVMMSGAGRL